MSKQTIYASDLKPFLNVMDLFKGSAEFALENPWFTIPGVKPQDPKLWMNTIPDSKGGLFINAPRIYHKTGTGVFNGSFTIGWTTVNKTQKFKKEYRIHAPVAQETLKRKQKLMCGPADRELSQDDNNMLLFSWQLSMAQDILLISKIFNIDLKKYADLANVEFYEAFESDVNAELKKRKASVPFKVDPKYVESWTAVPIMSKNKRKDTIFIYDLAEMTTPAFMPLMQSFYESIISMKGKQSFETKNIERVWSNPNCFSVPSIRLQGYIPNGEEEPKQVIDSRITFISKVLPTDKEFNEKFPDSLCTTWQKSKVSKVKLTKEDLPQLWGNTVYNPNPERHESARWSGCIFVQPQLSYSFHEKGSPGVEWRADTLALTRVISARNDDVEDACDFVDETEKLTNEAPEEQHSSDGAEFVGNEAEADPDAL